MKLKIRKGATVEVISGADKGKRGTVLEVNPGDLRVTVQGIRMQTHYSREDGLQRKEGQIHYSNLKLIDLPKSPAKKAQKAASKSK